MSTTFSDTIKFPITFLPPHFDFNRIIEESIKIAKLEELRADIGDELFSQLSEEDKRFFLETEGVLDFGYELTEKDLKRISKYIEEYED